MNFIGVSVFFYPSTGAGWQEWAGAGYFLSPGHLDSDNTEFSEGGLLRTEDSGMFQNGSFSSLPARSPREIFLGTFLKYKFIYFNWRLITLQYCSGFAIH